MSTVKITELPAINTINANTANTVLVGVDIPTNVTGKISLTTLAAGLYSNNKLAVGNNYTVLPDVVAQFTGNSASYLQVNLQNQTNTGSGDIVVTADDGTDTNHFIDFGINGSDYSDPTYSATKEHDGYLYVSSSGTNKGNLIVGTTNSTGRINFVVGGIQTENIIGFIDSTGISFNSINAVVSANAASANSVINARVSSNVATLRGEITSNVATLNGSITSNNTTVTNLSQAAFNKANSALANNTGIFGGNLTVSGDIVGLRTLNINNSNLPGNTQHLVITGTAGNAIGSPSNPGYTFHSAIDGGNRVAVESYGALSVNYPAFIGRRARGTAQSPTPVQQNDIMMRLGGNGYGSTKFSQFADARIEFVATENHTDTSKGSKIEFWTTEPGSNVSSKIGTMNGNQVDFNGYVSPTKGFIYVPRILTDAQTAITIDFAIDSMIRATFNSTLTLSLSNYTYGKVVECWFTNTAGNGQTINLGALSNNTTTGSTTLSVASGRSAKLQYFSVDGDLANTFCAITYA
jgi:hypothetical protein